MTTERDAIVRLEVIRLELACIQSKLHATAGDLLVDGLLRDVVRLRRERKRIIDTLGLGSDIDEAFERTGRN